MLKRMVILPLLTLMAMAVLTCGDAATTQKAPGGIAPAVIGARAVTAMSSVDMGKQAGKVTFVELWGVWCPPCIKSMPHVQEVYEQYKGNKAFNLMVVNTGWRGDNVDKVKGWLAQNPKYTFPVYFDDRAQDKQFATLNQVNSIPRSLLYDKKGKVRYNGHPMEIPAGLIDKLLAE